MPEEFFVMGVVAIIFVGLPWIIFHYVSKWKTAATLTTEDEDLLDELHELARRLDERMGTIERIVQAENPNWRSIAGDPMETALRPGTGPALEDRSSRLLQSGGLDSDPLPTRRSNRARRNA